MDSPFRPSNLIIIKIGGLGNFIPDKRTETEALKILFSLFYLRNWKFDQLMASLKQVPCIRNTNLTKRFHEGHKNNSLQFICALGVENDSMRYFWGILPSVRYLDILSLGE